MGVSMNKTVRIMDLDLNILDNEELEKKVREYLTNDYFNVILLASRKLLLQAADEPEFREMLLRADLILPGEEELLSLHHGEVLRDGGMIVNYQCLEKLLVAFQGEKKTIYTVVENKDHIALIEGFLKWFQPDFQLVGSEVISEMTDEGIVNKINSLAPDVLLLDMEVPGQERWIMEHSTQLNAKLCIGLGGVMERMIKEYKKEPQLISRLHLSAVYNALVRKNYYKKAKRERGFQRKMREYKERKGN